MLNVACYPVGPFQANSYVVWTTSPGKAILVDAGAEADRLIEALDSRDLDLSAVLLTHAHGDHIGALSEIVEATGATVYMHPDAEPMLHSAQANLSAFAGLPVTAAVAYESVRDGESPQLLGCNIVVLETPGHAPGSVSYYFPDDDVVFTGDALFAGSIGRTDFPGGSMETLLTGIRAKLLGLPDTTVVHSGHMGPTTIGRERAENPFLQALPPTRTEE